MSRKTLTAVYRSLSTIGCIMIRTLNIGCGGGKTGRHTRKNKQLNIDLIAGGVRADGLALPFRSESFEAAQAIHVLEHIPRAKHGSFIREAHRVLKPGGVLWIEVPNLLEVCRKLVVIGDELERTPYTGGGPEESRYDRLQERVRCWTLSVYGKHRHVGDAHCWGFMPQTLMRDMRLYNFSQVQHVIGDENMVSEHYLQEPVILVKATK